MHSYAHFTTIATAQIPLHHKLMLREIKICHSACITKSSKVIRCMETMHEHSSKHPHLSYGTNVTIGQYYLCTLEQI